MFKLIKWLFFLAILATVWLAITGQKIRGKTIEEHLEPLLGNKMVKEGIRDVRALVGEGLKAAGEAISEDVTDDERKQLDELVKKELMQGKPIEMSPGQTVLPAEINPQATLPQTGQEAAKRPTPEQMEVMPKTMKPLDSQPIQERSE